MARSKLVDMKFKRIYLSSLNN